jgi:decaprenyl-phosphate phosphoribosyltransferase
VRQFTVTIAEIDLEQLFDRLPAEQRSVMRLIPPVGQTEAITHPRRGPLSAAVAALRPRQWMKNCLVFVAPIASGIALEKLAIVHALLCFVAMSLIASATYLVNDLRDAAADRRHPKKRFRPIAARELSPAVAAALGVVVAIAGFVVGFIAGSVQLDLVLAGYVAVSLAYSLWLKHEEVICMACVALCFVIRVLAGAVATHAILPHTLVLTAGFGALFMVVGKRSAEFRTLGIGRGEHRKVLSMYSEPYLRAMLYMTATATVIMYAVWAFAAAKLVPVSGIYLELSVIPAIVLTMRYALLVERGEGGSPEDLVLSDRRLQVLGFLAAALLFWGSVVVPHVIHHIHG